MNDFLSHGSDSLAKDKPATFVALAVPNPEEKEALQCYSTGVKPLLKAAEGKVLSRHQFETGVVGNAFPQIVLAVEFPSAEAIHAFFASKAYQKLIPHRNKGFTSFKVFIAKSE